MPIDMSKIDLDAPLSSSSNQEGEGTTTPDSAPESGHTIETPGNGQPTDGGQPSVPEQNVPYSRFRDAIEARRDAERRAEEAEGREAEARERAERRASEPNRSSGPYDGDLPSWWLQMYGDNDNSRKAYAYEVERQDYIREEARREAVEAVREERNQESRVLTTNVNVIDDRLEDLSLSLGRPLSPQEEEGLLDIVDEYTPTGDDGRYAGDLLSFDKAWEIMQMRQSQSGQRSSSARRVPTAITSTRSQGETTVTTKAEADKNWNPRDWNSWRKRISER